VEIEKLALEENGKCECHAELLLQIACFHWFLDIGDSVDRSLSAECVPRMKQFDFGAALKQAQFT
jgi:hypothetical protein